MIDNSQEHEAQAPLTDCSKGVGNLSLSSSEQNDEEADAAAEEVLPQQKKSKAAKRRVIKLSP